MTRFMVIEHIAPGQLDAVYARFHASGRQLPDGLVYLDSWLSDDGARCFQLMETDDPALFDVWQTAWSDLVRFEVVALRDKPADTSSPSTGG
ncbi:MAG: DUF3303 family protein [Pseudomonadota bacterium]